MLLQNTQIFLGVIAIIAFFIFYRNENTFSLSFLKYLRQELRSRLSDVETEVKAEVNSGFWRIGDQPDEGKDFRFYNALVKDRFNLQQNLYRILHSAELEAIRFSNGVPELIDRAVSRLDMVRESKDYRYSVIYIFFFCFTLLSVELLAVKGLFYPVFLWLILLFSIAFTTAYWRFSWQELTSNGDKRTGSSIFTLPSFSGIAMRLTGIVLGTVLALLLLLSFLSFFRIPVWIAVFFFVALILVIVYRFSLNQFRDFNQKRGHSFHFILYHYVCIVIVALAVGILFQLLYYFKTDIWLLLYGYFPEDQQLFIPESMSYMEHLFHQPLLLKILIVGYILVNLFLLPVVVSFLRYKRIREISFLEIEEKKRETFEEIDEIKKKYNNLVITIRKLYIGD